MSIVSKRTVGRILIAFDDGASPPTDPTPLGSLVSVADGTLWISLGGGSYTQASGGGSLGDATVWPDAADWASLQATDLREGDYQSVLDIDGFGGGLVTYLSGQWSLFLVGATNPSDLDAMSALHPTVSGAIGYANDTAYQYNGSNWVRTPINTQYKFVAGVFGDLAGFSTAIEGDLAFVTDLDGLGSTGVVRYLSGQWVLSVGYFADETDFDVFVLANGEPEEGAKIYFGVFTGTVEDYGVTLPLGEATVWPPVVLATDVAGITGPRIGDRVDVASFGVGNASGTVEYTAGGWKIVEGNYDTVSQMESLGAPVSQGAIGIVGDYFDYYVYDGSNWVHLNRPSLLKGNVFSETRESIELTPNWLKQQVVL